MTFECNIGEWVESDPNPREREFRKAVHTVLFAISKSNHLRTTMLIKGGMLLAIRYRALRYTRDIDFSTDRAYQQFDRSQFLNDLEHSLTAATTELEYDLDCKIQSNRLNPSDPDASFPTLQLTIGYAPKQDRDRHRRLLAGHATDVVRVDYSFNELTLESQQILLTGAGELLAYSFSDLVAEKYRSILQQEIRNRTRRQDAYDLYELLNNTPDISTDEKYKILVALERKSESRGLQVHARSLEDPSIVARSRAEYRALAGEIPTDLPPFEMVYANVRQFYEALPW